MNQKSISAKKVSTRKNSRENCPRLRARKNCICISKRFFRLKPSCLRAIAQAAEKKKSSDGRINAPSAVVLSTPKRLTQTPTHALTTKTSRETRNAGDIAGKSEEKAPRTHETKTIFKSKGPALPSSCFARTCDESKIAGIPNKPDSKGNKGSCTDRKS